MQEPTDALFPSMPMSALRNVEVDHCLPLREIPHLLSSLAYSAGDREMTSVEFGQTEPYVGMEEKTIEEMNKSGTPSGLTCPQCNGALWELREGNYKRYRCHVGHSYLPDSLLADQSEAVTTALYSALRAVEEKSTSLRRIASEF